MINNEELLRLSELSKLEITDIEKMKKNLNITLEEINKIVDLNNYKEEKFIVNKNLFSDMQIEDIDTKKLLSNASNKTANYIKIRWFKND